MGEMRYATTATDLANEMGVTVERIGQIFRAFRTGKHPAFVGPFNRIAPLTPLQLAALRGEDFEAFAPAIDTDYKGEVPTSPEQPKEVAPAILEVQEIDYSTLVLKAAYQAKWDAMKRESKRVKSEVVVVESRRWPLWVALIITAGASIPNMVEVTTAIKGSNLVAWAMTGVFTLIPGLLIAARLRGFLWGSVVVGVMGYTAFCNASAIFGGLTALDKGFVLQPTVFLEAVTNMLNTPYLETARALSALMALLIGAIEYVAFKNLSK